MNRPVSPFLLGSGLTGDWTLCGAGLSASAQDPWVLLKSAGYTPRMTEGEILTCLCGSDCSRGLV